MNAKKVVGAMLTVCATLGLVSEVAIAQSKSREQVRQELIQARHEGITPASKTQYPPTEAVLARNKEIHAATTHAGERSPSADQHDQISGR
ncbi:MULTISPECIES: DUF4148 domain-containing protein [Caballeronia]|uniref:Purine nucleoside phosphorylase n=1 Tax=Caballeronia zhejiangensis TaxID=871203 RepID=A0A656QJ16_9BURK|nr:MULTISPECIES: DUF4148 domain-containing protein [Caballeronia]KDR28449.1 hypothetical protein BG60_10870 [Caballeronia zhejiangensis]MCE4547801.1 DUF4148 domain-containing protein [Caballeronia sp. PC1]MCE4575644.1 DUF4148 domain-containing protein [Caballeronia sp. CLC5]